MPVQVALYLEFEMLDCVGIEGFEGIGTAAEGEVVSAGATLKIDVHYGDLQYQKANTNWINWAGGSDCEDQGYRTREIAVNNIWAERVP